MSHFTLTPRFNLLLLFAYCVVLVGVIALAGAKFVATLGTSILLGAALGYLQRQAMQATSQELARAAGASYSRMGSKVRATLVGKLRRHLHSRTNHNGACISSLLDRRSRRFMASARCDDVFGHHEAVQTQIT